MVGVPHQGDFVQAVADNLQVWPFLLLFIPTTFEGVPQFIDKPKIPGRLRLVRSNSLQYRLANFL